ncbi:uncharacterized protein [Diabrotica undecimpunctata]|uniref:uncharacterized protein n=1 Tax=Diabrotica undecimpunctata TaxID=50387 RepID=UPI003B635ECA
MIDYGVDSAKKHQRSIHLEETYQCLDSDGLDTSGIRLLKNLNYNENTCIKVDQKVSAKVSINRGIRQGCVMSPMLFNAYVEPVFVIALNREGVNMGREIINNIRYADKRNNGRDLKDRQTLLNAINNECAEKGLIINTKKKQNEWYPEK